MKSGAFAYSKATYDHAVYKEPVEEFFTTFTNTNELHKDDIVVVRDDVHYGSSSSVRRGERGKISDICDDGISVLVTFKNYRNFRLLKTEVNKVNNEFSTGDRIRVLPATSLRYGGHQHIPKLGVGIVSQIGVDRSYGGELKIHVDFPNCDIKGFCLAAHEIQKLEEIEELTTKSKKKDLIEFFQERPLNQRLDEICKRKMSGEVFSAIKLFNYELFFVIGSNFIKISDKLIEDVLSIRNNTVGTIVTKFGNFIIIYNKECFSILDSKVPSEVINFLDELSKPKITLTIDDLKNVLIM